ncbi:MAG: O-antigen ligase family protein [Bacillota bacterium]
MKTFFMLHSNTFRVLGVILIAILIGLLSSFAKPIYPIALIIGFFVLILALLFPTYTSIIIIGIWSLFQGLMTKISISGIPLSQLIIIVICVPLFIGILKKGNIILSNTKNDLVIIYLIWTAWNMLGVFTTLYTGEALILYIRFIVGALIFTFFALGIETSRENNFIANVVVFIGVVSALITTLQLALYYLFGYTHLGIIDTVRYYYGEQYRPVGTFDGPVGSAIVLFTIYILSMYKYLKTNKKLYMFASIIIIIGILATLTRTTIVAVLISIVLQSIHIGIHKKKLKPVIKVLSLIAISSLLIFNFAYEVVIARLVDITQSNSVGDIGAGRVGIWLSVLNGFIQEMNLFNFLIGFGIDMSRYFVSNYSPYFGTGYEDATHNDFLDSLVSNGIISIILMGMFILKILKKIHYSKLFELKCGFWFPILSYVFIVLMLSNTTYSAGQRWFLLIVVAYMLKEIEFTRTGKNSS